MSATQREDAFWTDAKAAGNKEGFEGYLESYPKGRYVSLARANIARLSTANVQVVGVLASKDVIEGDLIQIAAPAILAKRLKQEKKMTNSATGLDYRVQAFAPPAF